LGRGLGFPQGEKVNFVLFSWINYDSTHSLPFFYDIDLIDGGLLVDNQNQEDALPAQLSFGEIKEPGYFPDPLSLVQAVTPSFLGIESGMVECLIGK